VTAPAKKAKKEEKQKKGDKEAKADGGKKRKGDETPEDKAARKAAKMAAKGK